MNYWLIAGVVLSVLAGFSTAIGTLIQQKRSTFKDRELAKFQELTITQLANISEVSTDTHKSSQRLEANMGTASKPEVLLTGVRVDWDRKVYIFQIENAGNATAKAVDLHLDYSLPGGHGKLIRTMQITKGKRAEIAYEIFPHYSMLQGATAEGLVNWRNEYDEYISSFKTDKRALIVNIALTYHWGAGNSDTEKYSLIHSRRNLYLSKDPSDIPYPKIKEP